MPRYFFDFDDGSTRLTDDEGVELPDKQAVWQAALDRLPTIQQQVPPDGRRDIVISVRDASGRTVLRAAIGLRAYWVPEAEDGRP
jgi:hypothetical protein